jgi:uncharacterized paraquat-inducible protein A
MNYCSIDDAWKNTDYISDQFKLYENPYEKKNVIENFDPNDKQKDYGIQQAYQCVFTCDNLWEHLNTCQMCRMKIRRRFSSKLIERLQNLVTDNKDTILLVLIAMFILVFFKLLVSIFRH